MEKKELEKSLQDMAENMAETLKENIRSIIAKLAELEEESGEDYDPNYAIINGIRLKRENETLRYCEHFDYDEAWWLAGARKLRVPSQKQWEKMLETGSTWDEGKKGLWIGKDHRLKRETSHSTFLPAAGNWAPNRKVYNVGSNGHYWISTIASYGAYSLAFSSFSVSPERSLYRAYGFSVRCLAK